MYKKLQKIRFTLLFYQQKRVEIFAIKSIAQICVLELEKIPHCDTINCIFLNIKVEEIRKYVIIRKKC